MNKNSMSLYTLMLIMSISLSSTNAQQWITRFHPVESQVDFIASSSLLPSDSSSLPIEPRGRMEYYTSTLSPVTTTTILPITSTTKSRRVPARSSLIPSQRKPYPARNVSINRKKIYEYGNQHQPSSPNHVHRKKIIYYKSNHGGNYHAATYEHVPSKQSTLPPATFIAYPIVYHRTKGLQRKPASPARTDEKQSFQVGQVTSNPPEQIAPVNPPTVTVTAPKFIRRKPNGRSASLLDLESSRLNPDRSLGNDMLYYPEPSTDDDAGSSSPDKNGISNDPNSEFVIIK